MDKALQTVGGVEMARLVARALQVVADPVIAVGPHAGLGVEAVMDRGGGPLAAMVAGWDALRSRGFTGPVVLAACDLPFIAPELFALLAEHRQGFQAVIPVHGGRAQPLAAWYAPEALAVARDLVAGGERSMKALTARLEVRLIPRSRWQAVAGGRALNDVDTPRQLKDARRWAAG